MTRSAHSPAKIAKKQFRQNAKAAGIPFHVAIVKAKQALIDNNKIEYPASTRRNPGRMDGSQWNGDQFVCPQQCDTVDDSLILDDVHDHEPTDAALDGEIRNRTAMQIDLLAIAKVEKPKGLSEQFEIVRSVTKVIALDEDEQDSEYEMDSDWDILSVYSESDVAPRMSYSRAVRGQG